MAVAGTPDGVRTAKERHREGEREEEGEKLARATWRRSQRCYQDRRVSGGCLDELARLCFDVRLGGPGASRPERASGFHRRERYSGSEPARDTVTGLGSQRFRVAPSGPDPPEEPCSVTSVLYQPVYSCWVPYI